MLHLVQGDNGEVLPSLPSGTFDLIYVDPPFNTGRKRTHTRLRNRANPEGDRVGFGGQRYSSEIESVLSYDDSFQDFAAFLAPRLREAHRLLGATGNLFVHLDTREVHYARILLDGIFGADGFRNEIIWSYDYGGRSKRRWPAKHDNILWYSRDPKDYFFDYEAIDRIPYMAPELVGPEKAARGKTPTDVWWQTIVPTSGRERTGYPTQKPIKILQRIVNVHCPQGGRVLDFFAGSGTTGAAAHAHGCDAWLIDASADAHAVMHKRFESDDVPYRMVALDEL